MAEGWDEHSRRVTHLRALEGLGEWARENNMKFNKGKCKVLHLGWHNPRVQHTPCSGAGEQPCWRGLEILVGHSPTRSQQGTSAATKAKQILGCSHRATLTGTRAVIIPLCSGCTGAQPRSETTIQERYRQAGTAQSRATRVIKGLESQPHVERFKEIVLLSLEKRRLKGEPWTSIPAFTGQKERAWSPPLHKGPHGYKFQGERFHVNVRTVINCNNLPRKMVESPSPQVFNMTDNPGPDNLI